MDVTAPLALLGGLSPQRFMRRHWQKKPLLVRAGWPGVAAPLSQRELFALVGHDDVESRVVARDGTAWTVRDGPFARRSLPPARRPGWTLLAHGLDLHVPAARAMLARFRFLPDARLDDLMLSWASDAGGVGPHVDDYDVFLLQVHGRRRWRIGPVDDARLLDGAPLKILRRFTPQQDWVLDAGDLLYLPPGWGHDGIAHGVCMTASIGFRAARSGSLAAELLQRLSDDAANRAGATAAYRDPRQDATAHPGRIPPALQDFAARAVQRALAEPAAVARALGESLTEPKPRVWFSARPALPADCGVRLDAGTRMLYDDRCIYINGDSLRAAGRDAALLHALADARALSAGALAGASRPVQAQIAEWQRNGWLHREDDDT